MKIKFKNLLASKGLMQSVLTVFGNMGATGISAVAIIIISRTLGPEKFGVFSVGFAIILMLNKICDLGLSLAQLKFVPRLNNREKQSRLFSLSIRLKLIITISTAVLGIILTPWIAEAINFSNTTILYLAFILNIFIVLFEQLLAMLQSLHRFLQNVIAGVIQASVKLSGALFLIFAIPENSLFAFSSYMLAPIVPLFFYKKLLPKSININLSQNFTKEKKKIWRMAGHSAIGFMALGIIDNIDILFVQKYLNEYDTGLLGGAARIAMLFSMAAYSLSTVLNPRVARYHSKKDIINYIKKAILLSIAVLIGYFLITPFSQYAILFTIGREYLESVTILNILLAASFITIITTPFVAIFFSLKKLEWYFSVSGIIQLLIVISGNAIFVPIYGLEAAAWTRVYAKLFLLLFTIIISAYSIYTVHFKVKKDN